MVWFVVAQVTHFREKTVDFAVPLPYVLYFFFFLLSFAPPNIPFFFSRTSPFQSGTRLTKFVISNRQVILNLAVEKLEVRV